MDLPSGVRGRPCALEEMKDGVTSVNKKAALAAFFLPTRPYTINWCPVPEARMAHVAVELGPAWLELVVMDGVLCRSRWHCIKPERLEQQALAVVLPQFGEPDQIRVCQQGSAFAQQVWQQLLTIPAGQTMTYGELARRLGSSARAIAGACRRNPVPGIVPCHRVVAADGIGGFMGQSSGVYVELKQALLAYEAEYAEY